MTPKPAITGCDEPGPFFDFWHHFCSKLASSMVNFCRRKRSFQWCPGQSDRPYGAWDKKLSVKVRAKFTATTHGYSMVKFARLNGAFLEVFLTASKPSRRQITAAKTKEKEKKEHRKKFQKSKSLKTYCRSLSSPEPKCRKIRCLSGKKGKLLCCKCLFNQIKANLAEIQPENHQNVQKRIFGRKLRVSGFKEHWEFAVMKFTVTITQYW